MQFYARRANATDPVQIIVDHWGLSERWSMVMLYDNRSVTLYTNDANEIESFDITVDNGSASYRVLERHDAWVLTELTRSTWSAPDPPLFPTVRAPAS